LVLGLILVEGSPLGATEGDFEPLGAPLSDGAPEGISVSVPGGALGTIGETEGNNDSDGPLDGETLGKSEGNNDADGAPIGSQVDTY